MSDTRLVGIALLLVVPLLVATGYMSARGGYASGSFWRSTRDEKLDCIVDAREYWLWMHATWVVLLLVLAGGMTGVGFVLAGAGEPALAGIGIGLSLISIACWLVGVVLQGPPAAIAAELRHETGHTPGWLAPLFTVVGWTELAYVAGTAAAYVVLGAAMVGSGDAVGLGRLGEHRVRRRHDSRDDSSAAQGDLSRASAGGARRSRRCICPRLTDARLPLGRARPPFPTNEERSESLEVQRGLLRLAHALDDDRQRMQLRPEEADDEVVVVAVEAVAGEADVVAEACAAEGHPDPAVLHQDRVLLAA